MTDGDLVRAVLGGDRDAFAVLYRSHVPAVVAAVRDHVTGREVVADVVQEVFLRALDGLAGLRDPERFRPWLLAIARNAAADAQRAEVRERARREHEPPAEELAASTPDVADLVSLREMSALVSGCVAGLSRRDATVLAMVSHLGFGPTDIADALGVTVGAAKVIVHRARRRLQAALTLELGVRSRAGCCPTFRRLHATDVVAAARHVSGCADCEEATRAEVSGFGASVVQTPTSR